VDPRAPVLAGSGVAHQHLDDPQVALEAVELMALACERAAPPSLLSRVEVVLVPRGTWRYRDPGRILADRFGADARTVVGEIGVLQQTLVTRACDAIARGDLDVALVVGGEAKYRDLRAQITGTEAPETTQVGVHPDEVLAPDAEILPRAEITAGLTIPAAQYATIETARRAVRGETVDRHARGLAELWAEFSAIAARNVDAWRRDSVPADVLLHPSPSNPMYCAPYTKLHCSQWNVDQASAFLICSAETARRHLVDEDTLVYPIAAVESNVMVPLARRAALHRAPAVAAGADELVALTGADPRDADHLDLYSCFPSAVQVQADELGIELENGSDRALTVTGGMTFAGGPLDNYSFQALAKMTEVLRAEPGTTGLVTCISGMITKHGMMLWSTRPPAAGFRAVDVSAATAAATAVLDLAPDYDGTARIDGYTVVHDRDGAPQRAIVVATTPSGARCVAANPDVDVAREMVAEEWVGRDVRVRASTWH
jgi:acetyl-CoA C-acetyltransferase